MSILESAYNLDTLEKKQITKVMKTKISTLLFFVFGIFFIGSAQPPDYDDLLILYADGEYEKCLKEAEKYTLKDKTKKDALPYLYLAKCNYKISLDGELSENYPKAFKDGVKYASKCIKYDTEGVVYEEEFDFFKTLKGGLLEELKNLVAIGKYPKMLSPISLLQRLDGEDVGSYWLKAAVLYRNQDKATAKTVVKEAQEKLDALTTTDGWAPEDFESLKFGVMEYCKAMEDMNQIQKAKDLLGQVKQWLEDDEEFMEYYDGVVN